MSPIMASLRSLHLYVFSIVFIPCVSRVVSGQDVCEIFVLNALSGFISETMQKKVSQTSSSSSTKIKDHCTCKAIGHVK